MADKPKTEPTTQPLTLPASMTTSAPAAPTFRIVNELYDSASGQSFKPGDEADLLARKAAFIGAIAHWVRNGDIRGAVPGLEGLHADSGFVESPTIKA